MPFSKRKIKILLIVLIVVCIPGIAKAADWFNPTKWVAGALAVIVSIFVAISNAIVSVTSFIFRYVTSEAFMSWNYTGFGAGGDPNPVVQEGWKLSRDLSNMVIAIYLAFIGLATALEIKDYKAKKVLPTLLGVALLINFTPVIAGAIIDTSNILTQFFLGSYSGIESFSSLGNDFLRNSLQRIGNQSSNPITMVTPLLQGAIVTTFNIVVATVYLIYTFLFFVRYAALWIAVIVSPFAALSLAIPPLKSMWKEWVEQFTAWAFIGLNASFYLYLSTILLDNVNSMILNSPPSEGLISTTLVELIKRMIPHSMALALLIFGLVKASQSNAIFADKVTDAAKATGKWTKKQTWDRFMSSDKGRERLESMNKDAEQFTDDDEWDERIAQGGARGVVARVGKGADKAFAWTRNKVKPVTTRPLAKAGMRESDRVREQIDEQTKDVKEKFTSSEARMAQARSLRGVTGTGSYQKKIALLNAIAEEDGREGLTNLRDEMPEFFDSLIKTASGRSPDTLKNIASMMPEIIEDKGDKDEDFTEEGKMIAQAFNVGVDEEGAIDEVLERVAKDIDSDDVDDMRGSVYESERLRKAIIKEGKTHIAKKFILLDDEVGELMEESLEEVHRDENLVSVNQRLAHKLTHDPDLYGAVNVDGMREKSDYKLAKMVERAAQSLDSDAIRERYQVTSRLHTVTQEIDRLTDVVTSYQERIDSFPNPNNPERRQLEREQHQYVLDIGRLAREKFGSGSTEGLKDQQKKFKYDQTTKTSKFTPEEEEAWKVIAKEITRLDQKARKKK